uniref:DUF4283 domain-containing protein n=1 Tax=Chenopodium quinoa TaxID=63459 RepID=A0A803M5D4_CHEQI
MWRPKGTLEVIDLGKDVYLFRFSIPDDYEKAILEGPWFIIDHYLMITKWKPNFRPSMNPFDRMIVWIRFPELPVEYYDKEALFDIAKLAGNPLRVDYATDHLTRARYARVFLDIDLSIPLVTNVWVGNGWQSIDFPRDVGELNNDCGHNLHNSGSSRCIGAAALPHPEVRMEFSSWDDMNNYYRTYGEQEGFGVVCIGGRNNDVYNKAAYSGYVWKCECYGITTYKKRVNGKRVVVYDEPSKKRKSKKCECPVMLYGQGHSDGVWKIMKVVNEHNHTMNPELSRHIAMYRKQKITKHLEQRIETDHASGASKVYTDAKFVEVQNQYNRVAYLTLVLKKLLSQNEVEHIIKVLDMSGVTEVPSMYVVDRWRKDISRKHTLVKVAYHDASKTKEASSSGEERPPNGEMVPQAPKTVTPKTPSSVNKGSVVGSTDTPNSSTCVKDPEPRGNNKKGRPRTTRYTSPAEKAMTKVPKTGGKKKQGKGHDNEVQYGQVNPHPPEFMQQQVGFPNVLPSRHHIGNMFPNSQVNNQGYFAGDPLVFTGSGSVPSPPFNRRVLASGIHMSQHSEAVGYFTANNAYGEVQFGDGIHFINPAHVPNTTIQNPYSHTLMQNPNPHLRNLHPHPSFS